jgi:predicted metalloprotease with PDZ domain
LLAFFRPHFSLSILREAHVRTALLLLSAAALAAGAAVAQDVAPQLAMVPPEIASPKDAAYPGTIKLLVDATDTDRHIYRIHETIPVAGAGPITLAYPRWIPGNHAPTGRIDELAGLTIRAGAARVTWTRDPVDVFVIRAAVPAGVNALDLDFQIVTPTDGAQGRVVMTPEMLNLQWNAVALYPAAYFARRIMVEPSIKLPEGWQYGTALETASNTGGIATFKPVNFDTLVDSPMYAGRNFKKLDLDQGGPVRVTLNLMADRPELLDVKPEQLEAHRNLVRQAYRLYGAHHYDHYDFLLALTDTMGGIGLEHHRSSENGSVPTYFTEWDKNADTRDLLPHEFTHSWNGKYRRPSDLWTPTFNVPMRDSLLWVYEGQTQYWGFVLAARSGMLTKQQALDAIAATAAAYDNRKGREWRPLQDTTNDPIAAMRRAIPWRSWQRSEDYYSEGELIWLDADTLIREKSAGKKSLDDFARAFFGVNDGSYEPLTYSFEDVVKTLTGVEALDWAKFLRTRLDTVGGEAPLDGIARGGYKLVYNDTPTDFFKAAETRRRITDLTYSLGFVIGREARITDVMWEGPAFKAGFTVGTQIIAVNGLAYDGDRLKTTVKNGKTNRDAIEFIVKNGDRYRTIRIDYHEGLRYPHLERAGTGEARLDAILAAKS